MSTASIQPSVGSVDGKFFSNGTQPRVMTSCDTLPCSAALSKVAALQKMMIAGFPGSSNKQEYA